MKIAILTQPLRTNYGGILQNYALQQTLKGMGHEVYTLDEKRRVRFSLWRFIKRVIKFILGRIPFSYVFYENKYERDYLLFTRNTRAFVRSHITLYPYRDLHKDLHPKSFDAYVVGSDQVWRPHYNDIETMFLDFTRGWSVKRVAYAASFGLESWEFSPGQTHTCAVLAKRFDAISVRENSGVTLCRIYLGVQAQLVLDPSMLLTKDQYAELVDMGRTKPCDGKLFVHILDNTPHKQEIVQCLAARYGAKPFTCNQEAHEDDIEVSLEKRIQPPVEQWLRSFMEAEYVVTDSFHGTIFSILFNKRFLVLENPDRGLARIHSLLETLGIKDCLASAPDAVAFPEIDYAGVNERIEQLRNVSRTFIAENLS